MIYNLNETGISFSFWFRSVSKIKESGIAVLDRKVTRCGASDK